MLTIGSTRLASAYHQVKVGGDVAAIKGVMKGLLKKDGERLQRGEVGLLDRDFIKEHTTRFEELKANIEATSWKKIISRSGLKREATEHMAEVCWSSNSVVICYGMGITQHRHGTEAVQQLPNPLLLRGNLGREGAGICPLRGHSNVEGDRTVGITEISTEAFLARLDKAFGISAPRAHDNAVKAIAAMRDHQSKGFIGLGGNLAVAMSGPQVSFPAFKQLDFSIQICTKLNRTCLLTARESIVLRCLGRTERDIQVTGHQSITVEDSMSMVHVSSEKLKPASELLKS